MQVMCICPYCNKPVIALLSFSGACPSCTEALEEMSELLYEEGDEITSMEFLDMLGE